MATKKPIAPACERNREPILDVLRTVFADVDKVLEIGSGTGQHAVFFAEHLPYLQWQCTELAENLAGIRAWIADSGLTNLPPPWPLDIATADLGQQLFPAIFSANTVHIIRWPLVEKLFALVGRQLQPGGIFCLYGPFNYDGQFTSQSNADFDQWLKQRDAQSGIRDVTAVDRLAVAQGLQLCDDIAMPANNRMLVWCKPKNQG